MQADSIPEALLREVAGPRRSRRGRVVAGPHLALLAAVGRPPRGVRDGDGRRAPGARPDGRRLPGAPRSRYLGRPSTREGRPRRDGEHRLRRRDGSADGARADPGRRDAVQRIAAEAARVPRRPGARAPRPASASRGAPRTSARPGPRPATAERSSLAGRRGREPPRERLPAPRRPLPAAPAGRGGRGPRDARRRLLHGRSSRTSSARSSTRSSRPEARTRRRWRRRARHGRRRRSSAGEGRRPEDAASRGSSTAASPLSRRPLGVDGEERAVRPARPPLRRVPPEEPLHVLRGVPLQRRRPRLRARPAAERSTRGSSGSPAPSSRSTRPATSSRA